jgi:hypothetical protein
MSSADWAAHRPRSRPGDRMSRRRHGRAHRWRQHAAVAVPRDRRPTPRRVTRPGSALPQSPDREWLRRSRARDDLNRNATSVGAWSWTSFPGSRRSAVVSVLLARFAFDELVEHISRQLGHAHATGVGDRPELVARGCDVAVDLVQHGGDRGRPFGAGTGHIRVPACRTRYPCVADTSAGRRSAFGIQPTTVMPQSSASC